VTGVDVRPQAEKPNSARPVAKELQPELSALLDEFADVFVEELAAEPADLRPIELKDEATCIAVMSAASSTVQPAVHGRGVASMPQMQEGRGASQLSWAANRPGEADRVHETLFLDEQDVMGADIRPQAELQDVARRVAVELQLVLGALLAEVADFSVEGLAAEQSVVRSIVDETVPQAANVTDYVMAAVQSAAVMGGALDAVLSVPETMQTPREVQNSVVVMAVSKMVLILAENLLTALAPYDLSEVEGGAVVLTLNEKELVFSCAELKAVVTWSAGGMTLNQLRIKLREGLWVPNVVAVESLVELPVIQGVVVQPVEMAPCEAPPIPDAPVDVEAVLPGAPPGFNVVLVVWQCLQWHCMFETQFQLWRSRWMMLGRCQLWMYFLMSRRCWLRCCLWSSLCGRCQPLCQLFMCVSVVLDVYDL